MSTHTTDVMTTREALNHEREQQILASAKTGIELQKRRFADNKLDPNTHVVFVVVPESPIAPPQIRVRLRGAIAAVIAERASLAVACSRVGQDDLATKLLEPHKCAHVWMLVAHETGGSYACTECSNA